jgi:hypothetical protein
MAGTGFRPEERDRLGAWIARMLEHPRPQPTTPPSTAMPFVPSIFGTVQAWERPFLEELVRESHALEGPIVEIGTLIGVTTTRLALWKSPRQRIITVDNYAWNPWGLPNDQHRDLAEQMLFYLTRTGQVERVDMDKGAFYANYRGPAPSLVFLDAWHTYEATRADIAWAREVGAGIVAGHDYRGEFPGVVRAVDEFGGPRRLHGTIWAL